MPRIPTYERKLGLTTEVPAVRVSAPEAIKPVAPMAEAMGDLGKVLMQIGENIRKVRSDQQETKAILYGKPKMDEIVLNATENPNIIFNEQLHNKELQQAMDEALKLTTDQEARANVQARLGLYMQQQQLKIKQFSYKKLIAERQDTLGDVKIALEEKWVAEPDPAQKQIIFYELTSEFKKAADTKVITYNDYVRNMNEIKKELPKMQIKWDIQNRLDYALGELQRGEFGAYKDVPSQNRLEFLKEAQNEKEKQVKKEKLLVIQAINENEDKLILMQINNDPLLTKDFIKQEANAGRVRPEFAKAQINNLESIKKIEAKTNSPTFNNIAKDILENKKTEKEIRLNLMIKNSTGELTDKDFEILYTFLTNVNKEMIDKVMPKKTFWQKLFNFGKDKGLREEVNTQMFKQYIQKVNAGEDPAKATSDIISLQLDNHLAEQAKYPNRQYAINPETKQRIYSDDGGATWYDEKTGKVIK